MYTTKKHRKVDDYIHIDESNIRIGMYPEEDESDKDCHSDSDDEEEG